MGQAQARVLEAQEVEAEEAGGEEGGEVALEGLGAWERETERCFRGFIRRVAENGERASGSRAVAMPCIMTVLIRSECPALSWTLAP